MTTWRSSIWSGRAYLSGLSMLHCQFPFADALLFGAVGQEGTSLARGAWSWRVALLSRSEARRKSNACVTVREANQVRVRRARHTRSCIDLWTLLSTAQFQVWMVHSRQRQIGSFKKENYLTRQTARPSKPSLAPRARGSQTYLWTAISRDARAPFGLEPCSAALHHRPRIVPPATDKNAAPDKPSRKRQTSIVAALCATAPGISQMKKKMNEPM